MFIYIDESGSFVQTLATNSWNVVAAYVVPEVTRRYAETILRDLKRSVGKSYSDEVKLRDLGERDLLSFLVALGRLESTVFVSCIDLGTQNAAAVAFHKESQVRAIRSNKPRMVYEEGRELIENLSARLERLPAQLYVQFVTQIDLLDQVFRMSTLYYAQRVPATLGSFRWRMDEKNSVRPQFEETMRFMAPPMLQSRSLDEPAIFVKGFDYSHYDRAFRIEGGKIPRFLQEVASSNLESASNLAGVLKDFKFVRSHDVPGVQTADLIASAFRRVLRNEFDDNLGIARALGLLMVQGQKPDPPIHLVSLSEDQYASGHVVGIAEAMKVVARSMLRH